MKEKAAKAIYDYLGQLTDLSIMQTGGRAEICWKLMEAYDEAKGAERDAAAKAMRDQLSQLADLSIMQAGGRSTIAMGLVEKYDNA